MKKPLQKRIEEERKVPLDTLSEIMIVIESVIETRAAHLSGTVEEEVTEGQGKDRACSKGMSLCRETVSEIMKGGEVRDPEVRTGETFRVMSGRR